jgi:uncharacterized protein YeaO (DUF488 family)
MAIRVVRLGTERDSNEGLRIGTVRRPPRGVPKNKYASQNWYDVWLPNVAPSPELVKIAQMADTDKEWVAFSKKYRKELAEPDKNKIIELLAALSHKTDFSVGCYCENEARCHRSVLKELLAERGAKLK